MAAVVVVGKHSFLARRFLALTGQAGLDAISHDELHRPEIFDRAECVLNFAIDPRMMHEPYREDRDVDLAIAGRLAPQHTRFVMISSRMVYAADENRGAREAAASGLNQYGKNKLETERRLGALLGDRLTVLRLGNVLGWERTSGYRSFILQVLDRLRREARIVYDVSPYVRRDFVTDRYLACVLDALCREAAPGAYNIGSGVALEVGRIALWVLEGFGRGELVITSPREHDEFWLDVTRATQRFGAPPDRDEIRNACLELGRQVARE